MSELAALSIEAAASRLQAGDFDAVELLAACQARIARLEDGLNCFITQTPDRARQAAEAAAGRARQGRRRGPLDGVPLALKDNIDVAGVATTNGLGWAAGHVADADADVVRNLEAAGAVLLGKLNMHEGALGGSTDNPHHGRTQNPWRRGHTPGGSSGGSGAAVAARLCFGALGTDTMGSVRLPAAYCGVVGFKPSAGLVSQRGLHMLCPNLDEIGPLARSVGDAALLLQAMVGGAAVAPAPVALSGLRVGLLANLESVALEADVEAAWRAALHLLGEAGASFAQQDLPGYQPTPARRAGLLLAEAEGWRIHGADIAAVPEAYSAGFVAMLEFGRDAGGERVARAEALIRDAGQRFAELLWQVDIVLAPTAAEAAFAFGTPAPAAQADLTALANFAGAPALSLPMGLSRDGLPLGLQLIAAPSADARLLAIGRAVEALLPAIGAPSGS